MRDAIAALDGRAVEDSFTRGEPVTVTIEGNDTPIESGDVTILKSYGQEWAGAADGQTVVMLDKRITPELKNEGLARDIVRNVQNLRKQAGLDIADRITLSLTTDSTSLPGAIDQCSEYIRSETLTTELVLTRLSGETAETEVKIDGQPRRIELAKVG